MVTRRQLRATARKMPFRRKVTLWRLDRRDAYTELPTKVWAEKRQVSETETGGSGDGAGRSTTTIYKFYPSELNPLGYEIHEGWVIEDGGDFWAVDSLGDEMAGERLACNVSKTVHPRTGADDS